MKGGVKIMIKTKGDILQAIPSDAYVRVKKCGLQTEIMYSTTHSRGGNTRKVGKDKYVIVDGQTGEVSGELNYKKSNSRIESLQGVKNSLRTVRDLINTNCTNLSYCKWLTLTYSYFMNDMKKLTFDFQNFNKRCRKKYGGYEYIAVNEPQSNGNWHIHCILIFSHKAPFMDPGEVKYKLWQQGNVDIHNIDNITNIAAYLTSYLQDAEDSESTDKDEQSSRSGTQDLNDDLNCKSESRNNGKKYIKKKRLSMYSCGSNIYRTSVNIKRPIEYYDTYENIQRANIGKITYKNVINISNGDKFRNTLIYEVYRLEDTK